MTSRLGGSPSLWPPLLPPGRNFLPLDVLIIFSNFVIFRGLDISGVGCVINYDMPKNLDDYVHRIGKLKC